MHPDLPAPAGLRIAILTRVFSLAGGGAESYSIHVAEHLAARHEVHVFAQLIEHRIDGVTYHRVPCPMKRPRWVNQLWYAWATWRATRVGFDIVHSHENTWHGDVQTIHVKSVRGNLLDKRGGLALALRWLKIATSPRLLTNLHLESARFDPRPGRQVVLTSQSLREQAQAAYPDSAAIMSVITPGVDMPVERSDARRQLGLPTSGPLLLFVANDYRRKGLDTLLEAMGDLPEDTLLMVVGNAAGIAAYQDKAQALGLARRVHFLGAAKDIGLAYDAATLLAHPTRDDTFAMVVLEAMAHGLPVVVSDQAYCGISALLQDGVDALLLTDPRDGRQLSAAIRRVLQEPGLAQAMADNGRRFAECHTWDEAARAYEKVYRASLAAREALRDGA